METLRNLKAWRNHFIINLIGALQSIWYAVLPPSWTGHDSGTINELGHMTISRAVQAGSSSPQSSNMLHEALSARYSDYLSLSGHVHFADAMVIAEWARYCKASNRHPVWADIPWVDGAIPQSLEWTLQNR